MKKNPSEKYKETEHNIDQANDSINDEKLQTKTNLIKVEKKKFEQSTDSMTQKNSNQININGSTIISNEVPVNNQQRAKKIKPLSMGESLLNKIVKESMKKSDSLTRNQIPKNNQKNAAGQNPIPKKVKENKFSSSLQKTSLNNSNPVLTLESKSQTKLHKTPSNGLDDNQIGLLNIKTCPALNVTISSCSNSLREGSHSKFKSDNFKLSEEILEFKLANSKLKNEMNIMNEKITTMKKIIHMKKEENDMIRSQYTEMIEDYRKEIDKLKKINFKIKLEEENLNGANRETKPVKIQNSHLNQTIKSTLNILLDLLEIFIAPRQNFARQSINVENISASYSMDIYDSYNNDEERRYTMIEGIQGLLVAKLTVMKKNLQLDLEKEIERVKIWSICKKEENNSNILNISSLKVPKGNDSGEKDENDFFDLSNSKLFINQSPKFNSVELAGKRSSNVNENINNYSLKKDDDNDNQLLNDSFLKDLKQSKSNHKSYKIINFLLLSN
jgi:hypothetical protein